MHESYELLIERFTAWAKQEENVRAAIIIGSRARTDHPADEWSDLDIILLAHDTAVYWQTKEWLNAVGDPWLHFVEPTPDGRSMEHRVLFAGGLDVDFVLSPAEGFRQMLAGGIPPDAADMIRRGIRFLVDKDNLAALLPNPLPAAPLTPPPAADEVVRRDRVTVGPARVLTDMKGIGQPVAGNFGGKMRGATDGLERLRVPRRQSLPQVQSDAEIADPAHSRRIERVNARRVDIGEIGPIDTVVGK